MLAIGVLLVIAGAGVAMQQSGVGFWKPDKPKDDDKSPVELAVADVASVSLVALSRALPLTGSLSPLVQTTVKAQASGEVREVTVREGQAVKQGDVLVRIDTRNLQAELDNRQAVLEKARADLALALLNRDNSRNLLEKRDRKSTRLNSSHSRASRMPSSA